MKCRDCRFIEYFTSEGKYWCHQKKDYVARMAVPKLDFEWAAVLVLFSRSYLDHIVDRGGRL